MSQHQGHGEDWDRYWASGKLHSCAGAYSGNYAGVARTIWEGLFAELPDGAVVVDIGTGNGAVPLIALEHSDGRGADLEIHGVDLAAIDPAAAVPDEAEALRRIRFHPRTSADELPFESGSVDAITGLYALEYTPLPATIEEVARVLKPGGRACFIMHHVASVVLDTANEEVGYLEAILAPEGLLARARHLADLLGAVRDPAARRALKDDPEAERRRQAFNQAAGDLSRRLEVASQRHVLRSALGGVAHALRDILPRQGLAACTADLDRLEAEFRANLGRLQDLQRAACDSAGLRSLAGAAESAGLAPDPPELLRHDADRLLGWLWRLHCPESVARPQHPEADRP